MAVPHPDKELDRLRAACRGGLPALVVLTGGSDWFRSEALEFVLAQVDPAAELIPVDGQAVSGRGRRAAGDDEGDADEGEEADADDASGPGCRDLQPLFGGGLFAQRAVVVVRRGDKWWSKHASAVASAQSRIQRGSTLVLETQKLDKRTRFGKELSGSGAAFEFRDLYETPFGRPDQPLQGELAQWVLQRSKKLAIPLMPESALLLLAQVGKDPSLLAAELDQLKDQFGEGGSKKALSPEDLKGKLTCSFESTPFELAEAVLGGDRRRAMRSLHAMFDRGVKQKDGKRMDQGGLFPFATSWLFSSVAQCLEGRVLLDQGVPMRDVPQKAGVFGFVDRFVQHVQKNSRERLEIGLLALLHCQRQRRLSAEEDDVLLERFLVRWFDGDAAPDVEDVEW